MNRVLRRREVVLLVVVFVLLVVVLRVFALRVFALLVVALLVVAFEEGILFVVLTSLTLLLALEEDPDSKKAFTASCRFDAFPR